MDYLNKNQCQVLDEILARLCSTGTLSIEQLLQIDPDGKRLKGLVSVLEEKRFIKSIDVEECDAPAYLFINPSGRVFLDSGGFSGMFEREQRSSNFGPHSVYNITATGDRNVVNTGDYNTFHIQQNELKGDIESLKQQLMANKVDKEDIAQIVEIVQIEGADGNNLGMQSKNWIRKMLDKSMEGTWEVGLATAGGILTECLKKYYGF